MTDEQKRELMAALDDVVDAAKEYGRDSGSEFYQGYVGDGSQRALDNARKKVSKLIFGEEWVWT